MRNVVALSIGISTVEPDAIVMLIVRHFECVTAERVEAGAGRRVSRTGLADPVARAWIAGQPALALGAGDAFGSAALAGPS